MLKHLNQCGTRDCVPLRVLWKNRKNLSLNSILLPYTENHYLLNVVCLQKSNFFAILFIRKNWFLTSPNTQIDIYILIWLVCLFVCLGVCVFVKTAEPIGPKFFVGHHVTTGKVYEWSKFQIFVSIKIRPSLNFYKKI